MGGAIMNDRAPRSSSERAGSARPGPRMEGANDEGPRPTGELRESRFPKDGAPGMESASMNDRAGRVLSGDRTCLLRWREGS